ncbi:unnamed protein product [Trypanosoma congolense IL3000]|uniref:WGS project CAEQ00000000 data, annotated contig 680 n=1 Tax=Trypanosoma congolense (strain IL3000) TaxID=1068625 RepID=F9WHP6_TRYCI|nr:unnamed protein product [Trypanosoma congolense IL3000]
MSANCPNNEYRITSYDDEEMCSALMHFGIPVGFRKKTSSVHIEGLLHFVTGSTASISPLQMEAHIMVSHTEFYRRLRTLGLTMGTAEPGVGDGFKKGLRETEGKVLNHHWSINPIRVPCQTSPGKHHAAEQRVPRNHVPPPVDCSTPVVNQWIDTNSNLESLLLEGIRQARHMFDYGKMRMCYEYLAHDLILSNRPIAAGTAIEFSQAASMYSFIGDIVTSLGGKTPEATLVRLINKMKLETPHLVNTKAFGSVRDALLEMSPMWRRFDQIGEWPRESDKADPLPADMFTFTAVREYSTSYFLVALRRPDGDVYSRRVLLNLEDLRECTSTIESVKRLRKEDIASRSLSGSKTSAIKWEEIMRSYLERVRAVASPLWGDFLPLLTSQRPSSCTLCLCLDPILQPLPLEKLSEFSSFAVVCRELSVPHIRHKTQLRNAKQLSGSSLFVIDPFGEYAADTPPLSGEGRGKTNNIDVITFQREGNGASSRPSLAYIRNALATKSYVNLLVNMCGSLADILQPKDVSQLHLDHMQIAIAFMGTKETSYCREQRNEACKNALNVFYERQDVVSLLLLARGVHLAIQNIFSLTAEECSTLCKRCLPLPGSGGGKTMSDVLKAVGVDSEDPCSFFVIYGTSQIGKPKGTS